MSEEQAWIGGARIGFLNLTIPFVKLRATERYLDLGSFLFWDVHLERSRVFGISIFRNSGIKIRHNDDRIPEHVVFWHFRPRKVGEALEKLGYQIEAE